MINPILKLNPKVFEKNVEKISLRNGFGDGLLEAGEKDKRIIGICADLSDSTQMSGFKGKFPERFVEVGVSEQNLAVVASGMSAMGKIPFISSYAVFSPGRNWEQIRTSICYNDRPVKIIGSHSGLSVGPDGGSHQALEDIAITRVLPRMTVITPCDAIEAQKAVIEMAKTKDPTYLRLAREKTPIITTKDSPFKIGKMNVLWKPISGKAEVAIFASGPIIYEALLAGKELEREKIGSYVVNVSTIKPIDKDTLVSITKEVNFIITIEEHQIYGGMGSAIAETLSENIPKPIIFMGLKDRFGQSGKPEELLEHYGLTSKHILENFKKGKKKFS